VTDPIILELKAYHRGEQNGISASELAARFRTSERQIRARIRDLRLTGVPIAGTPSERFFFPRTREEAEHTRLSIHSRREALKELEDAFVEGMDIEFGEARLFAEV